MAAPDIPSALIPFASPLLADATFKADLDTARHYAAAARAPATQRAYATAWSQFVTWCDERGIEPLPASAAAVAIFLAAEAARGIALPSLKLRQAAIVAAHRKAGLPPPRDSDAARPIAETLAGIRQHQKGRRPARKAPADGQVLRALLEAVEGEHLRAIRDRALLALGMAAALRRSELVALDVGDLRFVEEGLRLTIRWSKTDQAGEGQEVVVPHGRRIRPVALVKAWLEAAGHGEGPLFSRIAGKDRIIHESGTVLPARMSDRAVARLVQATAAKAGLDDPELFGGHSLRAGFLTEAARQGASQWKMQEVSRHKSMEVLASYVRDARKFEGHAGDGFL